MNGKFELEFSADIIVPTLAELITDLMELAAKERKSEETRLLQSDKDPK